MRIGQFVLIVCAGFGVLAGDAPRVAPLREGVLCIGTGDRVISADASCGEQKSAESRLRQEALGDEPYIRRARGATSTARFRGGQLPPPDSMREVTFSVAGEGKRWPVPATIELTDGKTTWQWGLAEDEVRRKQVVRLLPGDYRLMFSAPGHQRLEQGVKVVAETPRTDLGTVALAGSQTVSGVVVSPERRPVAGCAVLADGVALGFTDGRGRFDSELPVPPPRFVTLSHPQFAPRVLPIVREGDTPVGTVQLARGGSIACTIDRREIGDEVKISAELFQFRGGDTFSLRDVESLAAGETLVHFRSLDPGDYGIVLKGEGPMEQLAVPVTVGDGAVSEVFVSIAPLHLHLTVLYGDEPLGGATVHLNNSGTLERRVWNPEIRLDSGGGATVDIWQRGTIFAEVHSERLGSAVFAPSPLSLSIEEDTADWDIVVPRHRVQGIVYDAATAESVQGARVVHDSDEVGGDVRVTDQEGRFSFEALHDGTHVFRADSKSHLPSEVLSVTFTESSEERRLEFRLKKGETIPLEVRDAEGRAIAGAVVIDGCNPGSRTRGFRTDDQGTLALPSTGGPHSLCVLPMQGSFAMVEVAADSDTPSATPRPPVLIRVPAPMVTIRAVAKTTDGLPVAQLGLLLVYNGRVVPLTVLYSLAELQRRPSRTNDRGELLMVGMPVGHYEILAYATDEEAVSLTANRRGAVPVYVGYLAPGESLLDLVIEPRQ